MTRSYHFYSESDIAFVREKCNVMTDEELARHFTGRFGSPVTLRAIRNMRKRYGIKRDPKPNYTEEELDFLRTSYPAMPWQELVATFTARFGPRPQGLLREVCHNRLGICRAVGTEQIICRWGFPRAIVKTEHSNFKWKSSIVWEEANGPVPKGAYIVHLDGDTLNCEPDNLALTFRARIQKKLNEEIGTGRPELARAWLAIDSLNRIVNVRRGFGSQKNKKKD
ncbi:MAG: HNH endonuclease [Deltaproteobacteria bacterium]|jgi:hypothetical protein|nr:HNH endonuclease [Deltaproteobacteria bacterium]